MKKLTCILGCCFLTALLWSCKSSISTAGGKIISSQQQSLLSSKQTYSIDSLIKTLPKGSEVGISVFNLKQNKSLYTYRADKLCRSASTMKLITTITTLSYPEGYEPFTTKVWYDGDIIRDTLQGNIYVKGCMDPEFDDEAMDSLVAQIKKCPFKVLKGDIIGDVSLKDSLYYGTGWSWDDALYDFQPNLSPLMFHKGLVNIDVFPDSIHRTTIVKAFPCSTYYKIENETKYKDTAAGDFMLSRDFMHLSNHIFVKGNIDRHQSDQITVSCAPNYFLHTFAERLSSQGEKKIIGSYRYTYDVPIDYNKAYLVASWSTECRAVVKRMLKMSDNLNAEAMLYRLASICKSMPATAQGGISAIRNRIDSLGFHASDYKIVDGSGLSNYDYLSPELEVAFLRYLYSKKDMYDFIYPLLPIGGIDGSLHNRMKSAPLCGNVHAKTGSYTAINALAGYLTAKNGDMIAFSIMNQNMLDAREARNFQDALCNILY